MFKQSSLGKAKGEGGNVLGWENDGVGMWKIPCMTGRHTSVKTRGAGVVGSAG